MARSATETVSETVKDIRDAVVDLVSPSTESEEDKDKKESKEEDKDQYLSLLAFIGLHGKRVPENNPTFLNNDNSRNS